MDLQKAAERAERRKRLSVTPPSQHRAYMRLSTTSNEPPPISDSQVSDHGKVSRKGWISNSLPLGIDGLGFTSESSVCDRTCLLDWLKGETCEDLVPVTPGSTRIFSQLHKVPAL